MDLNLRAPKKEALQSFNIHRFHPENYSLICKWWQKRGFPCPKLEHIPPTGFIVSFGTIQICAGFLCKTDSNVAIIWHLASNPDCDKDMRNESVDFLIKFMTEKAKEESFTMVCFSTNIPKLGERIKKLNFLEFDKNVNVYGRVL